MTLIRKSIKVLTTTAIILLYFLAIPNLSKVRAEDCSPWGCKCSTPGFTCIRTGFGKYECLPPKQEAYDCTPLTLPHGTGNCNECTTGFECKRAGFGTYICVAQGAKPDDYLCNPWTQEPCKSKGQECLRVSWGHYECGAAATAKKVCDNMPPKCDECFKEGKVWTALGCIPASDLNEFVGWILGKLIFVASGIAFLLMAFGALQILTSAGNPEKVKAGQELITSALSGLLFIILSLFLLKLIGVDILHIPGFGT